MSLVVVSTWRVCEQESNKIIRSHFSCLCVVKPRLLLSDQTVMRRAERPGEPFSISPSWLCILETRLILVLMVPEWVIDEYFLVPLRLRLSQVSPEKIRYTHTHTAFDTVWLDTAIARGIMHVTIICATSDSLCVTKRSICCTVTSSAGRGSRGALSCQCVLIYAFFILKSLNSDTVAVHRDM